MKFILLAAAAVITSPALAQTVTGTTPGTPPGSTSAPSSAPMPQTMTQPTTPMTPQDSATPPAQSTTDTMQPPATTTPPPADTATMPPADTTMAPADATAAAPPAAPADGTDPVGGYAPTGSAITGGGTPGGPVTFRPAQTPDQAFPAPAPLASYPTCKAGQFDNCMQASDARRRPAARRRR